MTKIVYAQVTAATSVAVIKAGDPWDGDDPLVRAHPDLFGPQPPEESVRRTADRSDRPAVEQASRAPGERRGGVRRG